MKAIINDLVEIRDERWCWPKYDKESYQIQISNTDLYKKIKPYLKSQNVMVQAGGNCGVMLEDFVINFEKVYTFEPDPLNFYCLCINLPYTNLVKFQACLGNQHQLVSLNNGMTTNMQDVGAVHISEYSLNADIPTIKIDNLNLNECNLIQLDTEGFEYWALLGGIETIKKFHPVLCIEMNPHWAKRYGVSLEMVEKFIFGLGYQYKDSLMDDRIYT